MHGAVSRDRSAAPGDAWRSVSRQVRSPRRCMAQCLVTGPQTLPTSVLHRLRYSASCFNFQYPPFSFKYLQRKHVAFVSIFENPLSEKRDNVVVFFFSFSFQNGLQTALLSSVVGPVAIRSWTNLGIICSVLQVGTDITPSDIRGICTRVSLFLCVWLLSFLICST